MTTSRVTTSHTKKYEVTYFARSSLVWFWDLGRISSVGLAQAFTDATLILSLRLRIAEAGHLAVIHQNLSRGKAVPLQYKNENFNIMPYIIYVVKKQSFIYTCQTDSQLQTEVINNNRSYIFSNFYNTN